MVYRDINNAALFLIVFVDMQVGFAQMRRLEATEIPLGKLWSSGGRMRP